MAPIDFKYADLSPVASTISMNQQGPEPATLAEAQRSVVSSQSLISPAKDAPRPVENASRPPMVINAAELRLSMINW